MPLLGPRLSASSRRTPWSMSAIISRAKCVNRRRSGTHLKIEFKYLIGQCGFRSRQGPDRRRSGPSQPATFRREFNVSDQF
jgi:hypothetical protein